MSTKKYIKKGGW